MDKKPPFVFRHQFGLMLLLATIVSCLLVGVSLYLYNRDGTAQIDLSRPGYKSIRSQVSDKDDFDGYSEIGEINEESIIEIEYLIDERIKENDSVSAFGGDPLDPKTLGMTTTSE